jgi:anti-sigma B factor antagonist
MAANPVAPITPLHIEIQKTEEVTTAICHGRIVSDTASVLQEAVRRLLPESKRIMLDLGDVTYIDSSGLGALVGLYASARRNGGELKLANLTPRIVDLMRITHLAAVFEPYGRFF